MDRAGSFSCTISASDANADQATVTRTLRAYGLVNGARVALGMGIVDRREIRPRDDGTPEIVLSGDDQLRELAWRLVDNLEIGVGAPVTHASAVASLAAYAPGWTFVAAGSPGFNELYLRFAGETVLAAVRKLAQASGVHFWLSGERTLTFFGAFTASGLRAMAPPVGGTVGDSASVAWIGELARTEESYDIVRRISPFAAGTGRVQLGLKATSRAAGAGYTLDTANNRLVNNTAEALYGVRARRVDFPEIGPISNTDADVEAAANALFDGTLGFLQRHSVPVRSYDVGLLACPAVLRPGQTIPVVFRRVVDGVRVVDVDETLNILGATLEARSEGVRSTRLVVATVDRWPTSSVDAVVEQVEQGRIYRAHPQYNGNSYVVGYTLPVDYSYSAVFRFRFGAEVAQLQGVLFEFQVLLLESTVKTVGAVSTSTTGGGGTSITSTSGGGTSVSSGSSSEPGTTGVNLAAGDPHSHNFTTPAHTHSVTIGSHTHDVVIGSHTHNVTPTIQTIYGIFRESAGNTLALAEMEYRVNGGGWSSLAGATSLGSGWYRLDLTSVLMDGGSFRPLQESNTVEVRAPSGGGPSKSALLDVQLGIRNVIQSIAYS